MYFNVYNWGGGSDWVLMGRSFSLEFTNTFISVCEVREQDDNGDEEGVIAVGGVRLVLFIKFDICVVDVLRGISRT